MNSSIFGLIFLLTYSICVKSQPDEIRLLKDLFEEYWAGDGVRPVLNGSTTSRVQIGMALREILSFDEDTGRIHVSAWQQMMWKDELLVWDPEDYGGVEVFRVNPKRIWIPDIELYNSATSTRKRNDNALVLVYSDGRVLWVPQVEYEVTCHTTPEDPWLCVFKIGSWTYDGYAVDVDFYDAEDVDTNDFLSWSSDWSITETHARKDEKFYPCCKEPYPNLRFYWYIGKKSE